jgi:uncharacterized protein
MRGPLAWLLALLALLLAAAPAAAQTYPPRPDGPVLDQAGILPDDREARLDASLREYNQRTGRSVVVATVPSLEGETIEMYAVRLFEQWGIGGAESDAGLLLLVAPNERKVRIEVGYGLHQYVTDALSGRIIRGEITPRFREGDFAGGIEAGVNALVQQLDRTPADAKAIAEAAAAAEAQGGQGDASVGGFLFWVAMIVVFMMLFGRRGRRGRRFSGSGIAPIILWEAARHMSGRGGDWGGGGGFGGGGGGFGGFGGGMSGGGGASGSW